MDKLESARQLLEQIKMPAKQQSNLCCLTLLAMAKLKRRTPWCKATNEWMRIHDVLDFIKNNYGVSYAENSRETFRKQAMHPFRTASLIEDNGVATNSPNYRYRITDEFLSAMKEMGKRNNRALDIFMANHDSLTEIYASKKKMLKMPVRINNKDFIFSPGKHNQLQKAIIEEFAPRFAPLCDALECLVNMDSLIPAYTQRCTVHKADTCTPAQENLPDEHYQWDGNLTFQFNETVDYRLPLSRLGIIQTSLASALAAPSVVRYHFRKQMAHVLAYLYGIEMLQAAIP